MPFVAAALMSHGSEALPEFGLAEFAPAFSHQSAVATQIAHCSPETLVVVTPHGVRSEGMMTVSYSETVEGILDTPSGQRLRDIYSVNRSLAERFWQQPGPTQTAALGYGATTGEHNRIPLDWGAHVPLRFVQMFLPTPFRVVVLTPSRALSLERLYQYGSQLGSVMREWPGNVALIASGDLSHTHRESGPYGFDPAAAELDQWFLDMLQTGNWSGLRAVSAQMVEQAKPDALWQLAVVAGALGEELFAPFMLAGYSCPTYFGMASAFAPALKPDSGAHTNKEEGQPWASAPSPAQP